MKRIKVLSGWRALLLALIVGSSFTGEAGAQPAIDPEADTVLRQMSDHLKSVPSAVFRLSDTIDDVQEDGQKLQFAHVRDMTIVRPDKLRVETRGDVTNRVMWKDGKTLTVLDRDLNVYAQIPDTGTIAESIDMLQETYGMSTPAADLLTEDTYATLTEGCQEVRYVGPGYAGDEECHHLAFVREDIDYQLWVSTGEQPRPRKLVITYKLLPGEPQYTLQVLESKPAGDIPGETFTPQIPDDAERIDIRPLGPAE